MKQCVTCGRRYADDSLEFCLDDGVRLAFTQDSEATQISGGGAVPPPTQAWPPQPLPPPSWSGQPAPVQPAPAPKRSILPIILYSLVALIALAGGALGIVAYLNQPAANNNEDIARATPTPSGKTLPVIVTTPETVATPKDKPTPKPKPTPNPAQTPEPEPKPNTGCVLRNDDASQPDVNLRANCHVKSCDGDDSTIIGTMPNGTPITVSRQVAPVKGRSFMWQQVMLRGGRIAWVAASKIHCN